MDQNNEQVEVETKNDQNSPGRQRKRKEIGEINRDILTLVSRGSAIIAEILRLKDYIPETYSNPVEEKIYADIIFDFRYFQGTNTEKFEEKITRSQNLRQLDEDFRENNLELIERFFQLFASIYQYVADWEKFVHHIDEGRYIQYTLSNILTNKDLRHILSECVFHAGVMLLLVDRLIPGTIREKIMVSYYRYKGETTIKNFREISSLFANTKYLPAPNSPNNCKDEKRPPRYPVDYFARANFSKPAIKDIIGALKDTDIYDQMSAFPKEDHKTHALSNQASMLVILLFFYPDYLDRDSTKMREISDKFFNDNWIISIYMGYTIDLNEYWKEFKAAKRAIDNTLIIDELRLKKSNYAASLTNMFKEVTYYISEGIMTEEYVLSNIEKLLGIDREANVCLKWFILQSTITYKKYQDIIKADINKTAIIRLLFVVSQFEYQLKTMFQNLIDNKDELWDSDKANCKQKFEELISFSEGKDIFAPGMKREDLASFFKTQLSRLEGLGYTNPNSTSRKIIKIRQHVEGVKKLYQIEENQNAKQNIKIIMDNLDHMLRIVQVRKSYLVSITKISDFAYAWINIQDYIVEMQTMIKQDSKNVLMLRAAFMKLASILNFPLIRLLEIESEDIESVTNYYSGELVSFVKSILQIIPTSVFGILKNVVKVFQSGFEEITTSQQPIQKKKLENFSQFQKRDQLAKCTYEISQFTKGILLMEKTLMGVIEVDPKVILEEGIRKELIQNIALDFHNFIDISVTEKFQVVEEKLKNLIDKMAWNKKSFLYNQDYININGCKIWSEEMHRLMNNYVELEANKFLQRKIKARKGDYDSGGNKYQIPHFTPLKYSPESPTFLGRLTRYILNLTSPKCSTFYPMNFAFYSNGREVFGIKMLNKIKKAIGVEGLQGFGKLLTFMNYHNILEFQKFIKKSISDPVNAQILKDVSNLIGSPFIVLFQDRELGKKFQNAIYNLRKDFLKELVNRILQIGQIELLRKMQNYSLSVNAEVDSYLLSSQIKSLNEINLLLINNELNFKFDEESMQNNNNPRESTFGMTKPEEKNPSENYFQNLCQIFEDFGYIDPLHTFYVDLSSETYLPILLGICTYSEMNIDYYIGKNNKMVNKNPTLFDLYYYSIGIYSILFQAGRNNIIFFIAMMSKILKLGILNLYSLKVLQEAHDRPLDINKETAMLQLFLQSFAYNCNIDLDYFGINFNDFLIFRNISN
ncbi:MAG: hypothetical protein MJ252_08275 [archaeon]|nr:hypothetical protein [archaeon]